MAARRSQPSETVRHRKGVPENEGVLTTSIAEGSVGNQFLYEHRVGRRGQYEVFVPFDMQ